MKDMAFDPPCWMVSVAKSGAEDSLDKPESWRLAGVVPNESDDLAGAGVWIWRKEKVKGRLESDWEAPRWNALRICNFQWSCRRFLRRRIS